jgi:hypothetical protein
METEKIERQGMGYKPSIDWGETGENFEEQLKKNKLVIQEILESYDKATNSDIVLLFEFWNLTEQIKITESQDHEEVIIRIRKDKVPFMTSPETISRVRRLLNAKGLGLPTNNAVFVRRMRRQKVLRNYFSKS